MTFVFLTILILNGYYVVILSKFNVDNYVHFIINISYTNI